MQLKTTAFSFAILLSSASALAKGPVTNSPYPSFLETDSMPNAVNYLPAPPDTASVFYYNDWAKYNWGKSLRNTERGIQAKNDASLAMTDLMKDFEASFGLYVTEKETPEMYKLIYWALNDAINATQKAKKHFHRKRPYVQMNESSLIPEEDESHRQSGSYPSSHSAAGWAVALLLTEINPSNQDAILARGYEYGQSRIIAGYHYQSDVDAARVVASAAVARLHANADFNKQMEKAKKEYAKAIKKR